MCSVVLPSFWQASLSEQLEGHTSSIFVEPVATGALRGEDSLSERCGSQFPSSHIFFQMYRAAEHFFFSFLLESRSSVSLSFKAFGLPCTLCSLCI